MKTNNIRVEWAGCSNYQERKSSASKAHEEFEASSLKKRLEEGFHITEAKIKHRRPRIQVNSEPRMVITIVFGKETKVNIQDYNTHYKPCGFKAVKFIY